MTPPTTHRAPEPDQDLRERLRRSDPLATRAGRVDPTSLQVLVSEVTRTRVQPAQRVRPATRRPRRLAPAVAGAAVVVAVAVGVAVALSGVLDSDPPTPEAAGQELALTVPVSDIATTSTCVKLSPEVLAPAQVAFDGVVTEADVGLAVLTPTRWYAGEQAATVVVTVPPQVDTALVGAPQFAVGKRYLVSGSDGRLAVCGASGEWSSELESLYRSAFPG